MKRYTIQAKQTLVEIWTYTVEANSEEEALQLVEEGEVEDNDDHYQNDLGDLSYSIEGSDKVSPCVGHDTASWEEEQQNKRMDIVGQNGNEGTHYDNEQ